MLASVGSTNSRYSTSSRYDKLVCIAVAVVAIGLFQHHRYEIQPQLADVTRYFVDGQLAEFGCIDRRRIVSVGEIRIVLVGLLSARIGKGTTDTESTGAGSAGNSSSEGTFVGREASAVLVGSRFAVVVGKFHHLKQREEFSFSGRVVVTALQMLVDMGRILISPWVRVASVGRWSSSGLERDIFRLDGHDTAEEYQTDP